MTTEPSASARPIGRRLRPFLIGTPLALVGWAAVLVLVTLFQPPGRTVAVVSPAGIGAAIAAVAAAGGSIVEIRRLAVIAISDEPGFVAALYSNGPLVVVGARKGGCGFGAVVGLGPGGLT